MQSKPSCCCVRWALLPTAWVVWFKPGAWREQGCLFREKRADELGWGGMGAAWQHGAGAEEEAQPESTNGVRSARWDGSETLQSAKGRVSQRALFSGSYRVLKEELFSRLDLISLQKILIDLSGGERGLPLATRWACLTVCTLPLHKQPSGNLCVWETWKFGQIQGQAAIQVANSKPHFCLRLTRRRRIGFYFTYSPWISA